MAIKRFAECFSRRSVVSAILIALLLLPGVMQTTAVVTATTAAEVSADPDEEIVYIDNNGAIRVLDTLQSSGSKAVDWVSPTTGWSNFALGDVNNDGDEEIIAVRSTSSGTGELTVFDPVVSSGSFDDTTPNEIPWATLYTREIPGSPKLVATGKLDPNLPGDHIFYTYDFNNGTRVVALKPAIPNPNGREWAVHYTRDFDERWEQVSIGNVDQEGADEIALVDDSVGRLSVFRSDATSDELLKRTGDSRPYRATTIAQYDAGSTVEVIAVREAPATLSTFFVLKWSKDDEEFDETEAEAFAPAPRFIFGADINNDGKEAIVMLRNVSGDNVVRMIVRGDDGEEVPTELEQFLDADNGYQAGAGGDVDGDGRDEIVIMRDNNIRIYTQAERNASRDDYALRTDGERIHIGDLDRNGFSIGPSFSTSISSIEESLQIGTTGATKNFEVRNETTNAPISFEISVDNNPSWFNVTPRFGNTPAVISYTPNAIGLAPGEYLTTIILTSNNQGVINQPYTIKVKLTVTPANIDPSPDAISFNYLRTSEPTTMTQQVSISGAAGIRFTAGVQSFPQIQSAAASLGTDVLADDVMNGYIDDEGNIVAVNAAGTEVILAQSGVSEVPGLTVTPTEGTLPGSVTLTLRTAQQVDDFERAYLVIIGDARTGLPPQNVRLVPISMLRATEQLYLPTVFGQ